MAIYFTHTCGHEGCGERVVTHPKRPVYDHVGGVHRGRTYDHVVTTVVTTRTDDAA
jgi:hypothetical protein